MRRRLRVGEGRLRQRIGARDRRRGAVIRSQPEDLPNRVSGLAIGRQLLSLSGPAHQHSQQRSDADQQSAHAVVGWRQRQLKLQFVT